MMFKCNPHHSHNPDPPHGNEPPPCSSSYDPPTPTSCDPHGPEQGGDDCGSLLGNLIHADVSGLLNLELGSHQDNPLIDLHAVIGHDGILAGGIHEVGSILDAGNILDLGNLLDGGLFC